MNKKILSEISTTLFIIGLLLVFVTEVYTLELSSFGLILITLSLGITCTQIADLLRSKILKYLIYMVSIIVTLTVTIFILNIY